MKAGVEFLGFASVALVAHLAVFSMSAPEGGTDAGGASGTAEGTEIALPMAGIDPHLAALVRQWEEPVTPPPAPPAPLAAPPGMPPPEVTRPADDAPALPALPRAMSAPTGSAQAPQAETRTPQLFDTPEAPPRTRPRARPAQPPAPQRAESASRPRTAPTAEAPRNSAAPASRAQGSAQGTGGQGQAQSRSGSGSDATLLAQWGGGIRAAIQRQQRSPATSARGTVQVQLQVASDGRLSGVRVTSSSGHTALDRAAVQAVQRARLPQAPSGIGGTHAFNLPLTWR